jgi:hypothetical protein
LEAETPKEIALSIMAEIVMLRRGGSGKPMQWMGEVMEAENPVSGAEANNNKRHGDNPLPEVHRGTE